MNRKGMKEILSEERFNIISNSNKAFITAFDKHIENLIHPTDEKVFFVIRDFHENEEEMNLPHTHAR
ncbi:MAG: hypothetical protein ACK5JH_11955 [Anaerocolumna sp.]